MSGAVDISYEHGIKITKKGKSLFLDPHRNKPNAIVTHGHADHLAKKAIMTHPTKDILKIRRNWDASASLDYGQKLAIDDMEMQFLDAGHVLGSAMVMIDDILYTGDFNPEGGLTSGKAQPHRCRDMVVESTYGKRCYSLPDKQEVVSDFVAWLESVLEENSAIIGCYEFGKAQEIIAICNKNLQREVHVPLQTARLCEVYAKHGIELDYRVLDDSWFENDSKQIHRVEAYRNQRNPEKTAGIKTDSDYSRKDTRIIVVPPSWLKWRGDNYWQIHKEKKKGASTCYVSGWCAFYRRGDIDADSSFPLSDHADFDDILEFVSACSPEKVYTVNGSTAELAVEIRKTLGIAAEPLN